MSCFWWEVVYLICLSCFNGSVEVWEVAEFVVLVSGAAAFVVLVLMADCTLVGIFASESVLKRNQPALNNSNIPRSISYCL